MKTEISRVPGHCICPIPTIGSELLEPPSDRRPAMHPSDTTTLGLLAARARHGRASGRMASGASGTPEIIAFEREPDTHQPVARTFGQPESARLLPTPNIVRAISQLWMETLSRLPGQPLVNGDTDTGPDSSPHRAGYRGTQGTSGQSVAGWVGGAAAGETTAHTTTGFRTGARAHLRAGQAGLKPAAVSPA